MIELTRGAAGGNELAKDLRRLLLRNIDAARSPTCIDGAARSMQLDSGPCMTAWLKSGVSDRIKDEYHRRTS
jgi:hypothetical protein